MMSRQTEVFEESLEKVDKILKLIGLGFSKISCEGKSFVQLIRCRLIFSCLFLWVNTDLLAEIAWFIDGVYSGISITELTYVAPCITQTLLGDFKAICYFNNEALVSDLIQTLRKLHQTKLYCKVNRKFETEILFRVCFLTKAANITKYLNVLAIVVFSLLPVSIIFLSYYFSHKIQLTLPFLVLYPFDVYDLKYYPFVYIHAIISGFITVFFVFAPDYFYYFCCTFIQIQFRSLQLEIEKVIPSHTGFRDDTEYKRFLANIIPLLNRHKELVRCVYMMEQIYSKSTLYNVVVSSFLICLTGFNVTAIESWPKVMPFIAFLGLVLIQIYLFCFFADKVKESSVEVANAVYNASWYNTNLRTMKDMLFILKRAQKPSIVTAWKFSEISLITLTKILSTASSYFALLCTINRSPAK